MLMLPLLSELGSQLVDERKHLLIKLCQLINEKEVIELSITFFATSVN